MSSRLLHRFGWPRLGDPGDTNAKELEASVRSHFGLDENIKYCVFNVFSIVILEAVK